MGPCSSENNTCISFLICSSCFRAICLPFRSRPLQFKLHFISQILFFFVPIAIVQNHSLSPKVPILIFSLQLSALLVFFPFFFPKFSAFLIQPPDPSLYFLSCKADFTHFKKKSIFISSDICLTFYSGS